MKSGGRYGGLVNINRHSAKLFVHALSQPGPVGIVIYNALSPYGDERIPVLVLKVLFLTFEVSLVLLKQGFLTRQVFWGAGDLRGRIEAFEQLFRSLQNRFFTALKMPGLN